MPGTYAIKIDELVYEVETLKIPFKELAVKYNCTYTNVYAKYSRYKKKLAKGEVHTDNKRSLPMDIHTMQHHMDKGMSYQDLAVKYETSYQNVYNYYKRHRHKVGA
jgi:Mor family transcriptional regulator